MSCFAYPHLPDRDIDGTHLSTSSSTTLSLVRRVRVRSSSGLVSSVAFMCHTVAYSRAGKDYSNPRVLDFHNLNKPDEDMYDRGKVPRMPW